MLAPAASLGNSRRVETWAFSPESEGRGRGRDPEAGWVSACGREEETPPPPNRGTSL